MINNAEKASGRPSPIHGYGLFADSPIQKGEVILKIMGKVVSTDLLSEERIREGKLVGIAPGLAVIREGTPTKFSLVNH